jgi:ubiquinone/menaquinone biosynthesis C-methylase UbiE
MGCPEVNQLEFISCCFKDTLAEYSPPDVAIFGCGTGNGLEYIDNSCTGRVTVVDINSHFLQVVKERFANKIRGLSIIHEDLNNCTLNHDQYSLIFVSLVFEFVDMKNFLKKIYEWLKSGGVFRVVLQLPNDALPHVSQTKFESIKKLGSIAKVVDIEEFKKECTNIGLKETETSIHTLESGKSFYLGTYKKS